MQGLRGLFIELYMLSLWEPHWMNLDPKLFELTRLVQAPNTFHLIMPFRRCPNALDVTDLPFRVEYPREEPEWEGFDAVNSI